MSFEEPIVAVNDAEYLGQWLNYWLANGAAEALTKLVEMRAPLPDNFAMPPDAAESYPLTIYSSARKAAPKLGMMGVLQAVAATHGQKIVVHYAEDAGGVATIAKFELVTVKNKG